LPLARSGGKNINPSFQCEEGLHVKQGRRLIVPGFIAQAGLVKDGEGRSGESV